MASFVTAPLRKSAFVVKVPVSILILFAIEAFAVTSPFIEVVPYPPMALSNCPPVNEMFASFVMSPSRWSALEVNVPVWTYIWFAIEAFAVTFPSIMVVPNPVMALSNCPPVKETFELFVTLPSRWSAFDVNVPLIMVISFAIDASSVTSPSIVVVPSPPMALVKWPVFKIIEPSLSVEFAFKLSALIPKFVPFAMFNVPPVTPSTKMSPPVCMFSVELLVIFPKCSPPVISNLPDSIIISFEMFALVEELPVVVIWPEPLIVAVFVKFPDILSFAINSVSLVIVPPVIELFNSPPFNAIVPALVTPPPRLSATVVTVLPEPTLIDWFIDDSNVTLPLIDVEPAPLILLFKVPPVKETVELLLTLPSILSAFEVKVPDETVILLEIEAFAVTLPLISVSPLPLME